MSLRVVTQAQAQKDTGKKRTNASQTSNKKLRKRSPRKSRSKTGKKSKSGSKPEPGNVRNEKPKVREDNKEPKKRASTSLSSSHKGGFVLVDKKYEPLEAAIRAYESRLSALVDLPDKLKQYQKLGRKRLCWL